MFSNFENPSDYDDFNERGIYFLNNKENEKALADFDASIRLRSPLDHNPAAHMNRAFALENLGRIDEAILALKKIIHSGLVPYIYYAHDNLGAIYLGLQEWTKAAEILKMGLGFMRNSVEPEFKTKLLFMYYNYAIALRNLEQYEDAIKSLDAAIQIDDSDIDFFIVRSELNFKTGYFQQALSDIERILALDGKSLGAYWLKGLIYAQLNEHKKEMVALEQFTKLGGPEKLGNAEHVKLRLAYLTLQVKDEPIKERPELSSAMKIVLAEELMDSREFDAAKAVLGTIKEPNTEHLTRLNRLYLADSLKSGLLGLLEEWIQENQPLLEEAKKVMIRDVRSYLSQGYSREINQAIINELKRRKEMSNMNFVGINLEHFHLADIACGNSNFTGSDLSAVDFSRSDLSYSRFIGAKMGQVKAISTSFFEANLVGANLFNANLENANFQVADLRGADLETANLMGANLKSANLMGTNLEQAHLNNKTILPDGNFWNSNSDLTQFTHLIQKILPFDKLPQIPIFQPIPPKQPPKKLNWEQLLEEADNETSIELDQWDPDSDNFVGRNDGMNDDDY